MTGPEQRELGVLATKMANLEEKFEEHREETRANRAEVKSELRALNASVQSILDKMNGWRGGWKAMVVAAGIASTLTGFIFQYFQLFPPHK